MLHLPWIAALSLFALGGAAAAAPAEPMQWTWVEGQLAQVDPERHTVVVRHGRLELRFALDPRAEIVEGSQVVSAGALHGDVGCAVYVRYCVTPTGRVADFVEVIAGAAATDGAGSDAPGARLPLYRQ